MLEWRVLGTAMILPTIGVAVYLAVRSAAEHVFWINLAICSGSRQTPTGCSASSLTARRTRTTRGPRSRWG